MREILTIIAACIVVALAAALAVPPFVDWTKHSAAIAQKLGEGFGGRVALEGPVRLRLLPAPRLTAGALVAERAGLVIRARETTLELSAPALLRGAFEFTDIDLDHAEVSFDPASLDVAGAQDARVAVARFRLIDAALRVAGAHPLALDHVDMTGAADTLAGPFRGQGVWRGARVVDFSFSTGPIEQGRLRGKFAFDDRGSQAHVEATGEVALEDGATSFSGQAIVNGALGGAPARAAFTLTANSDALHADKIDVRLGDDDHALSFSGAADLVRGNGLDAHLQAASLDLDRFRAGHAAFDATQAAPALALRLQLAADSVTLGGQALTNVAADIVRKPDATPRIALDAGLPGRTRLHYDGAFDPVAARAFDGDVKIETRDAGKLAAYIAPVAPELARWLTAGAFARLSYDGHVRVDADGVTLAAQAVEVDRSRLAGAIDWRAATANARSRLDVRLVASLVDIDSLPDFSALAQVSAQDDLTLSLDAQSLRVARVGAAPAETGRLRLSVTRADGVTLLKNMSILGLGGANLSGSGRLTEQGGGLDFKLDAERLNDLAVLVRRVAPGPASEALVARALALSPAHLTFSVATDASGAFTQINLAGDAGGARYSAQAQPAGQGRMQARLSMQAPEAATLLRQAGLAVLPLKGIGGARLEAEGEGVIGAPLQTRANLDLAGLSLRFAGETLFALDRASARGELVGESADFARLAPLFAFGAPDLSTRIPLSGRAQMRVDGHGLALSSIAAEVAGVKAKGELARDVAGAISGALALNRLSAPGLAALALGPPQPAPAGALWPMLKFAPARFDPPNADVALDVGRLDLGAGLVAQDARMRLSLAPGVVSTRDLEMKLGEGRISGEAALRREGGVVIAKVVLSGAGLSASAGPFAARVNGVVDLSGAGSSMAELAASLAGSARLKFSDARIARAAPDALAQVVAETEKAEGAFEPRVIAQTLARELDKNAQRLPAFESDATIASGRLSLAPDAMRLGNATAHLSGALDLRTGAIDVREALSTVAPEGWAGAPRIEISWSGERGALGRDVDAGALIGALAARAIAREAERNAALEADIHERAFFNRRLKMDRRNDEERRALEEARRILEQPPAPPPAPPSQRREPASVQTPQHPAPPKRPPAAFAPATRGVAPDPSTAGRY
ncbi:MAG: hypothetical protein KDJ25_03210 [Rhodoblastus sp.]|nr:hypothetical protein [Rhodoblastus sp.]